MLKINLFALFAGGEIANLVLQSGPVAKAVLVILLVFSLFSWAIILSKWSRVNRARRQSGRFIRSFRKPMRLADVAAAAHEYSPSPLIAVFEAGYDEHRRQTSKPSGRVSRLNSIHRHKQTASP